MTGLLLALLAQPTAASPLDRFSALMRAHPSFGVKFTVQFTGQRSAWNGELRFSSPTQWKCEFKDQGKGALIVRNGSTALELDTTSRLFALGRTMSEANQVEPIMFPWSIYALPVPLLLQSISATLPARVKPVFGPPAADGTSLVSIDAKEGGGSMKLRYAIAADGRLLKADIHVVSAEGSIDQSFKFSSYSWTKFGATEFSLNPPLGYSPFVLPRPGSAANPEAALRLGRWTGQDGKVVDLDSKLTGRTVIVLLDPESPASRRAATSLEQLSKSLAGKATVVALVAGPPDSLAVSGVRAYYDPAGKTFDAIVAPGYPAFYLLGADRKPIKAWMGDVPSRRAAMFKEILDAIAE